MNIRLLEQVASHGLAGAAFEQDVVGNDHGGAPVLFQDREDVLDEVELFVTRRCPEVVAVDGQRLARRLAGVVHDRDAALLTERRIG